MDNKIGNPNAGFSPVSRKAQIPIRLIAMLAILLLVLVLLQSCTPTPSPDGTPAPQSDIASDPTSRPENAVMCGNPEEYECEGLSGHSITFANVPENVSPYMLPVSPEEEEKLRNLPTEDIGCIISIVGNMAFYDADNNLVTSFPSTVNLTYTFTEKDNENFEDCKQTLIDKGILAKPSDADYVPIYLYNKPDIVIWKPFQDFTIENGTVTINFIQWGDQQSGFGTRP